VNSAGFTRYEKNNLYCRALRPGRRSAFDWLPEAEDSIVLIVHQHHDGGFVHQWASHQRARALNRPVRIFAGGSNGSAKKGSGKNASGGLDYLRARLD